MKYMFLKMNKWCFIFQLILFQHIWQQAKFVKSAAIPFLPILENHGMEVYPAPFFPHIADKQSSLIQNLKPIYLLIIM